MQSLYSDTNLSTFLAIQKPSDLLIYTMDQLKKSEVLGCKFDLKKWLYVETKPTTQYTICLAGAAMLSLMSEESIIDSWAKAHQPDIHISPIDTGNPNIITKLWAINDFAQGAFNSAFERLGYPGKPTTLEYIDITPMNKNLIQFKTDITELINKLIQLNF